MTSSGVEKIQRDVNCVESFPGEIAVCTAGFEPLATLAYPASRACAFGGIRVLVGYWMDLSRLKLKFDRNCS